MMLRCIQPRANPRQAAACLAGRSHGSAGTFSIVFDVPTNSALDYFRLGVWDPAGLRVDLHAGAFDVHERAIGLGAQVLAGAALGALDELTSG